MNKIIELKNRFKEVHEKIVDAINANPEAQPWVIKSIWDPSDPSSISVPDPDLPGGAMVAYLCRKYGIK